MSPFSHRARPGPPPPVLWTRGQGCGELAALLCDGEPVRVTGDLTENALRHRAELLVCRRLPGSFDLINVAVPVDFAPEEVKAVVAAVAGGPHSGLAARVAQRLALALGAHALMACAYRSESERDSAVSMVERLYQEVPDLEYRTVQAADAGELVSALPERSLLVFGAPGGNWFQRVVFGQGAKLRQRAPAGAVIVRSAPDRVFQFMQDPVFVGPLREAADIPRVHPERVLAVVDLGMLVGLVRREALEAAPAGVPVAAVMEPPLAVKVDASVEEAEALAAELDSAPIPVVDEAGRLVGAVRVQG